MKVIGIDVGTTSICGVVLDTEHGRVLFSETRDSNAFLQTPHAWEKIQDVEKICSIARDLLDRLLEQTQKDVVAIGLTGQMHGIVYLDAEGDALGPLYTWQDGRGNLPYEETTYAAHLGSFSGYGNVTDFYNRIHRLVPTKAVTYSTVHDYLGMRLCGLRRPQMHISNAASLGLFDSECQRFAYPCDIDVTDAFVCPGRYRGIPVAVAIGDNQASVFSTLTDERNLLINVGTGSQVSLVSERPITGEGIECRPYVDGKYLIVGSALCGGRAYSLLKEFYRGVLSYTDAADTDVYRMMERMLENKTGSTLRVDPRFDGTRRDPTVRGSIQNVTVQNLTPEDLTYGMLEGMIGELYEMYQTMGEVRCGIVGSGNGIRKNRALVRIAEQRFGSCLRIPRHTEEAACGAALFALVAAGACCSAAEAQQCMESTET